MWRENRHRAQGPTTQDRCASYGLGALLVCEHATVATVDDLIRGAGSEGHEAPGIRPSCCRTVTPSSRPTSSAIMPSTTLITVVPVNSIFLPESAGSAPIGRSSKAAPV